MDQTWVSCIGRWILYHLSHQGSPTVDPHSSSNNCQDHISPGQSAAGFGAGSLNVLRAVTPRCPWGVLASVCGCSVAPLLPPLCSWQGPCPSVELCPAQQAPSWEDARGRTQASVASEAKRSPWQPNPAPRAGVTGFGFPGPGRAAGTHKLEKLGCRPKAHCPGITGSPDPTREAVERRSEPGSPSPPSWGARMALKAWSPEEVSALCPEGSELWHGGGARLRQWEQDAG